MFHRAVVLCVHSDQLHTFVCVCVCVCVCIYVCVRAASSSSVHMEWLSAPQEMLRKPLVQQLMEANSAALGSTLDDYHVRTCTAACECVQRLTYGIDTVLCAGGARQLEFGVCDQILPSEWRRRSSQVSCCVFIGRLSLQDFELVRDVCNKPQLAHLYAYMLQSHGKPAHAVCAPSDVPHLFVLLAAAFGRSTSNAPADDADGTGLSAVLSTFFAKMNKSVAGTARRAPFKSSSVPDAVGGGGAGSKADSVQAHSLFRRSASSAPSDSNLSEAQLTWSDGDGDDADDDDDDEYTQDSFEESQQTPAGKSQSLSQRAGGSPGVAAVTAAPPTGLSTTSVMESATQSRDVSALPVMDQSLDGLSLSPPHSPPREPDVSSAGRSGTGSAQQPAWRQTGSDSFDDDGDDAWPVAARVSLGGRPGGKPVGGLPQMALPTTTSGFSASDSFEDDDIEPWSPPKGGGAALAAARAGITSDTGADSETTAPPPRSPSDTDTAAGVTTAADTETDDARVLDSAEVEQEFRRGVPLSLLSCVRLSCSAKRHPPSPALSSLSAFLCPQTSNHGLWKTCANG